MGCATHAHAHATTREKATTDTGGTLQDNVLPEERHLTQLALEAAETRNEKVLIAAGIGKGFCPSCRRSCVS